MCGQWWIYVRYLFSSLCNIKIYHSFSSRRMIARWDAHQVMLMQKLGNSKTKSTVLCKELQHNPLQRDDSHCDPEYINRIEWLARGAIQNTSEGDRLPRQISTHWWAGGMCWSKCVPWIHPSIMEAVGDTWRQLNIQASSKLAWSPSCVCLFNRARRASETLWLQGRGRADQSQFVLLEGLTCKQA